MRENLFSPHGSKPFLNYQSGGGKMGSTAILKAHSNILGMMRARTGQPFISKQGFVLASIK
jgi:hypothetical protein